MSIGKIRNIISIVLLIQFTVINLYADDWSSGVIQFDKLIYNAANQNWGVSANSKGFIYFSNTDGLLEFDGTNWKLYNIDNQTIVRAVNVASDSLIYTSGYMELGYWKPDEFGDLKYYSLTDKAKKYFSQKNIEFWNIAVTDSIVYFHSFNRLLAYQDGNFVPVILTGSKSVLSKVNDRILVAVRNEGIYEIKNDKAVSFIRDDAFFKDKLVKFIIPYDDEKILIGTASHGIFVWDGQQMIQWNPAWTEYFIKNELNRGYNRNGEFIFGSIIDGIVVFDKDGNLKRKINSGNGLPNNTVLGIECDPWGNIWVAMDSGIGFISNNSERSFLIEETPGVGAIYDAALLNDYLYLGSNQGLFARPVNSKDGYFTLVPGTQGQVWDLQNINGNLWAGHNLGTFKVVETNAKLISDHSGGFALTQDPKNENLLIQSTYSNFVTYKKDADNFALDHIIEGFYDLIRFIEIDHLGNIWASHMHRGIYKITTDDDRKNVIDDKYFGNDVFNQNGTVHVFKLEDRIIFTTGQQIFTYDDLRDTIIQYKELNDQLGKFASAHRIINAPNNNYWFISDHGIGLLKIKQGEVELIKEFPSSLFKNNLVDRNENILPLSEDRAMLTMYNAIAYLDASVNDTINLFSNFKPLLRSLEIATNRGKSQKIPVDSKFLKIKHNFHNIKFNFSFPHITELPIDFQYKLSGLYNNWSSKITGNEFFFERLPKGKYNLSVKVSDPWGNESQIYSFDFEVLPPWYLSEIAVFAYSILLILTLLLFRSWGIRQTKRRERLQHEKRERELIRLRNEKLSGEIQHKSKELANSTMAIIKKNEFLLDLKKTVTNQKNELGTRFPDKYYNHLTNKIDKNISNQDDWKVFETNFEQAHEQFFKKIKEAYPDLTSSDLRLCAYLRMNLSSKEIAPLLGISVRGVENHRYRLRKKLNLGHDKVLTDKILSI